MPLMGGAIGMSLPKVKRKPKSVSVKSFGAIGDGVADDTLALQRSIDSSDVVYLEAGVYKCSSALIIRKSNFRLFGEGELVFKEDFLGGAVTIADHVSNIGLDGLSIRLLNNVHGFAFCGVFSNPDTSSVVASHFTNLKIIGAAFGINVGGRKPEGEAHISKRTFLTHEGQNTITGNVIRNSLFYERIGSGGAHGIYVRGAAFNLISNNRIENMQGGILAASSGIVSNNVILNCYRDNGIYCAGGSGLNIHGNYIENTKGDGIAFNHAAACSAVGNQIHRAGNAALRFQDSHDISVSGNMINSVAVSSSYVRCFIDADSPDAPRNIVIEDNLFSGGITKGNAFAFGTVPLGMPYMNWRIEGNQIREVDLSSLSAPFFGPYAIVNFGHHAGNKNLWVEDNLFSEIRVNGQKPTDSMMICNATRVADNVFEFVNQ